MSGGTKRERKRIRLSTKNMLLLLFVLMLIIPYGTTSLYFLFNMQRQTRINATTEMASDLEMLKNALNDMLEAAERVSYLHLVDNSIASILQHEHKGYDYEYYTDEKAMQNAIMHASSLNSSILSVTFYSLSGDTYCLNQIAEGRNARNDDWLNKAFESESHLFVAPVQRTLSGKMCIPLVFALFDSQGAALTGYVQSEYDLDTCLTRALSNMKSDANAAVWQGDTLLTGGSVDRSMLTSKRSDVLLSEHSPSGLTIAVWQNAPLSDSIIMRNINLYLTALALMLLLVATLGGVALGSVGHSIKQLSRALDGVKRGEREEIDVPENVIVGTELKELMHSYNELIEKLTKSTQQEYELRLEQQRAVIKALENQVNPHFLYNSLNLIASLIQLGERETAHTVALSLGDVMRYCIKGGSMVRLGEDLTQTGKYIYIMEKRFPDRLQIAMNADPTLDDRLIPKFLLQPLIENSVIYGLDSPVKQLHVTVEIKRESGCLRFSVRDDGPGLDEKKLADILSRIDRFNRTGFNPDEQVGSVGLFNVHARVRARYGEGYGVTIASKEGDCLVVITLPDAP